MYWYNQLATVLAINYNILISQMTSQDIPGHVMVGRSASIKLFTFTDISPLSTNFPNFQIRHHPVSECNVRFKDILFPKLQIDWARQTVTNSKVSSIISCSCEWKKYKHSPCPTWLIVSFLIKKVNKTPAGPLACCRTPIDWGFLHVVRAGMRYARGLCLCLCPLHTFLIYLKDALHVLEGHCRVSQAVYPPPFGVIRYTCSLCTTYVVWWNSRELS